MPVNQMTWGHSALHYAALYGHKEMVIMLLKRGADPRLETAGSGKNALQVAAVPVPGTVVIHTCCCLR